MVLMKVNVRCADKILTRRRRRFNPFPPPPLAIMFLFALHLSLANAFSLARLQLRVCRLSTHSTTSALRIQPNFWEPKDASNEKFNPYSNSNNSRVSLRDQRMQEINEQLLDSDPKAMQRILAANRDFLIEPLEDTTAASSAMYANCTTRAERYRAYERAVDARIAAAKGNAVKNVLRTLKTFVLAQE